MKTMMMFQPLGMGRGAGTERENLAFAGVTERKLWILGALGVGMGVASSLYGGISASRAAREAEKRQRAEEARENGSYLRRYNQDYVDTAAGQNLVRMARESYQRNINRAAGAQAVAGGTDAATAIAKEQANKAVGDTIANIAATDQSRKDSADRQHEAARQRFAQMDMQREQQRAQSITDAAQGASNAMMSAASAIETANAAKPITGAGNNSKVSISPSVHEDNLGLKTTDVSASMQPFSHTDDDLLKRMAGQVREKIGV